MLLTPWLHLLQDLLQYFDMSFIFFSVHEILVGRFLNASFLCNQIQNCREKGLSGYEYNPGGVIPSSTHVPLSPPLHACPQTHTNMNKSIGLVPVLFMKYHTQKCDNLWSDCFGVGGGYSSVYATIFPWQRMKTNLFSSETQYLDQFAAELLSFLCQIYWDNIFQYLK